ncbi:MAG: T9SS type A sorting domain-containing protein [Flavobacteriales bacterium]|nr:T9SS type A sorting domain-containing protein [Flavobacteriales bacterium]
MRLHLIFTLALTTLLFTTHAQIQLGADIDGEVAGDLSGGSVSISSDGSRVAIGAYSNDGNGNNAGHVRIYEWTGSSWIQLGADIDGEAADDYSGYSVSISSDGSRVAIGARFNDGNGTDAGHVRIYEWTGSSWIQLGADIDGEAAGDQSGVSVFISSDGSRVVIGASQNDGNGTGAGHVRIYEWSGSSWIQLGADIDGEAAGDLSGSSVSISSDGSRVAIGAYGNDGNGTGAGHVRIYEWSGSSWTQLGADIDGEATDDLSGSSVSISSDGSRVAIGAGLNDGNGTDAGHVRIFEWTGSSWVQLGADIDGEAEDDQSGNSISISSDGNHVAIGAYRNNGNGFNAGHVRFYEWTGSSWTQLGADIDGEAIYDRSGNSVSISSDGSRIAIGGYYNGGNGTYAGQVRIYSLKGVYGKIYHDINENCLADATETGLKGRGAIVTPGNYTVETTSSGFWIIDSLPAGTYTITVDTSGKWSSTCPISQSFTVTNPEGLTQAPSFGFISTEPCAEPNVSVNMPFMRPGFSNQNIYVNACNDDIATGALLGAYIDLEIDSLLILQSASILYTAQGDNTYRFILGDMNPGQCVSFSVACSLSVDAVLGQTLCMQANLYPADSCVFDTIPANPPGDFTPCELPWDKSSISVDGWCQNDSIYFIITNTGDLGGGDMDCYSPVRLYIDGVYISLDSIQLFGGQTDTLVFAGDGRTYRLEVDQHPLHPGNSHPNATVERCGNVSGWTPDLVNVLPMNDADPVVDIYCGLVTGSYDPNDKTGYPTGVGATHKVLPNNQFEYRIRFQNTGTDTAFTVVVRDTLDLDLDIFSVRSGASSHNYSFRIYGQRVLEWTFSNIMLPDSNVNEPASNGFVTFTVDQNRDLADGVEINNTANIYFDFNTAIITNTTSHIIDRSIGSGVVIVNVENLDYTNTVSNSLIAYPNPTTSKVEIRLNKTYSNVSAKVTDITGRVVSTHQYQNVSYLQLDVNAPSGIYFIEIITDGNEKTVLKLIKE